MRKLQAESMTRTRGTDLVDIGLIDAEFGHRGEPNAYKQPLKGSASTVCGKFIPNVDFSWSVKGQY